MGPLLSFRNRPLPKHQPASFRFSAGAADPAPEASAGSLPVLQAYAQVAREAQVGGQHKGADRAPCMAPVAGFEVHCATEVKVHNIQLRSIQISAGPSKESRLERERQAAARDPWLQGITTEQGPLALYKQNRLAGIYRRVGAHY